MGNKVSCNQKPLPYELHCAIQHNKSSSKVIIPSSKIPIYECKDQPKDENHPNSNWIVRSGTICSGSSCPIPFGNIQETLFTRKVSSKPASHETAPCFDPYGFPLPRPQLQPQPRPSQPHTKCMYPNWTSTSQGQSELGTVPSVFPYQKWNHHNLPSSEPCSETFLRAIAHSTEQLYINPTNIPPTMHLESMTPQNSFNISQHVPSDQYGHRMTRSNAGSASHGIYSNHNMRSNSSNSYNPRGVPNPNAYSSNSNNITHDYAFTSRPTSTGRIYESNPVIYDSYDQKNIMLQELQSHDAEHYQPSMNSINSSTPLPSNRSYGVGPPLNSPFANADVYPLPENSAQELLQVEANSSREACDYYKYSKPASREASIRNSNMANWNVAASRFEQGMKAREARYKPPPSNPSRNEEITYVRIPGSNYFETPAYQEIPASNLAHSSQNKLTDIPQADSNSSASSIRSEHCIKCDPFSDDFEKLIASNEDSCMNSQPNEDTRTAHRNPLDYTSTAMNLSSHILNRDKHTEEDRTMNRSDNDNGTTNEIEIELEKDAEYTEEVSQHSIPEADEFEQRLATPLASSSSISLREPSETSPSLRSSYYSESENYATRHPPSHSNMEKDKNSLRSRATIDEFNMLKLIESDSDSRQQSREVQATIINAVTQAYSTEHLIDAQSPQFGGDTLSINGEFIQNLDDALTSHCVPVSDRTQMQYTFNPDIEALYVQEQPISYQDMSSNYTCPMTPHGEQQNVSRLVPDYLHARSYRGEGQETPINSMTPPSHSNNFYIKTAICNCKRISGAFSDYYSVPGKSTYLFQAISPPSYDVYMSNNSFEGYFLAFRAVIDEQFNYQVTELVTPGCGVESGQSGSLHHLLQR